MPTNRLHPEPVEDIHLTVLAKPGGERYVWCYRDDRFASNPELSFTWGDAARLSEKMRDG